MCGHSLPVPDKLDVVAARAGVPQRVEPGPVVHPQGQVVGSQGHEAGLHFGGDGGGGLTQRITFEFGGLFDWLVSSIFCR